MQPCSPRCHVDLPPRAPTAGVLGQPRSSRHGVEAALRVVLTAPTIRLHGLDHLAMWAKISVIILAMVAIATIVQVVRYATDEPAEGDVVRAEGVCRERVLRGLVEPDEALFIGGQTSTYQRFGEWTITGTVELKPGDPAAPNLVRSRYECTVTKGDRWTATVVYG